MPKRKTPIERGRPPAYRSPPTTPLENPIPENPNVENPPPHRRTLRRNQNRPPPTRRAYRPRAAKSTKKDGGTSWFDLTEQESTPPEVTEVTGEESPIPAIPLRSVQMTDLFEAIDASHADVTTPATTPASPPAASPVVQSVGQASEVVHSKPKMAQVASTLSQVFVEGLCSSDTDDDTRGDTPVPNTEDEGVFLPEYFLPFSVLRVRMTEKRAPTQPQPILRLTGPENVENVDHTICPNVHTTVTTEPELQEEVVVNRNSDIPDLNAEIVGDLNTDVCLDLLEKTAEVERGGPGARLDEPIDNLPFGEWRMEDEEVPEVVPVKKKRTVRKKSTKRPAQTYEEPLRKKTRSQTARENAEASLSHNQAEDDAAAMLQHPSPPKRKRSAQSKNSLPLRPTEPFSGLSSKKAERWWLKFQSRIALPDKGIDKQSMRECEFIKEVVEKQGIKKLCKIPTSYNMSLVREFYAELAAMKTTTFTVRGVTVSLKAKNINRMFGLTPPKHTDYYRLTKNATIEELEEVIELLGIPGSSWEDHSNYMLRVFKANNLSANANVWINFIRHTIDPTTHDSSVSVERMLLLFCLVTGRTINMGRIMVKRMRFCATRTRGKMYFPYMLTKMLKTAGVPQYQEDQIIKEHNEKWEIDMKSVTRLRDRKEKGGTNADMLSMLKDLLAQNGTLIQENAQQKKEWGERLDTLRKDLTEGMEAGEKKIKELVDQIMAGENERAKAKKEKLKQKVRKLKAEKAGLIAEIQELKMASAIPSTTAQPTIK